MKNALGWAALLAALVGTASAEYSLAAACGFSAALAACVPAALDIYALAAFRAHRDITAVVTALICVNAASHLVSTGLLPVGVPLVVAVSAIAPLVLWRVHVLQGAAPDAVPDAPEMQPSAAPIAPDAEPSADEMHADAETSAPDAETSAPDAPADADELLSDARTLDEAHRAAHGRPVPLRALQSELRIGQRRAQALKSALVP